MTSQADFVQPPRIANWLVNLFAGGEEAESLVGDMLEEFSNFASKSGVAFARSWYWRQTRKTIAHLVGNAFRVAPWLTRCHRNRRALTQPACLWAAGPSDLCSSSQVPSF